MLGSVEGWVFLRAGRRLVHADEVEVRAGQILEQEGPVVLGQRGLHASRRAIDALRFARGPVVARVLLEGEIVEGVDQVCGSRRTTWWIADASEVLERFMQRAVARAARDSAPDALDGSGATPAALVDRARERVHALDDELRDARWRAGTAQTDLVVRLTREVGVARARVSALEAHERALRDGAVAAHGVCDVVSRAIAWNVAREGEGEAWDRAYSDAWNELAEALERDLLALGESAAAERPCTSEVVTLRAAGDVTEGETLRHDMPADVFDQRPPDPPPAPYWAEPQPWPDEPDPPIAKASPEEQRGFFPTDAEEQLERDGYALCPGCQRIVRATWIDEAKVECRGCGPLGWPRPMGTAAIRIVRVAVRRLMKRA